MFIRTTRLDNQRGVSLLEVLISIVIIAIGVLGLAKMQALSISNTQTSGNRGLIALQASGLAALMHSNKAFWQIPASPNCSGATACVLSGSSLATNSTSTPFTTPPALSTCTYASPCSALQIASIDVNTWMGNMYAQVPTYTLNINCSVTGTNPNTCIIQVSWIEKQQGMNQTTASVAAATPSQTQQYFLYVQP